MTVTVAPARVTTSFATIGPAQSQVRRLLNSPLPPADADSRSVILSPANLHIGVLPEALDCVAYVHIEPDSDDNPVLILASVWNQSALYFAVNLADRAPLSDVANALSGRQIELLLAGPFGAHSHRLHFTPSEARYLEDLVDEHLELGLAREEDWMQTLEAAIPHLPHLVANALPEVGTCEQHHCIVIQGSSENHLRAVRRAISRCAVQ